MDEKGTLKLQRKKERKKVKAAAQKNTLIFFYKKLSERVRAKSFLNFRAFITSCHILPPPTPPKPFRKEGGGPKSNFRFSCFPHVLRAPFQLFV